MSKGYQSFADGRRGSSASADKLTALRLPDRLDGKSVLDIGCNEGFFCFEAHARGAARVVGIDARAKFVESARERAAQLKQPITFEQRDVMDLPVDGFDYIFLFSALHAAKGTNVRRTSSSSPPEVSVKASNTSAPIGAFRRIHDALAPDGALILECGVVFDPGRSLKRALRSIGENFFPTLEMLEHVWLREFTVGLIGPSVSQIGDPVTRHVFHCRRRRTSVCLIIGPGDARESLPASEIAGAVRLNIDNLLKPVRWSKPKLAPAQANFDSMSGKVGGDTGKIWMAIKNDEGVRAYFAGMICHAIRQCRGAPLVVVEGVILADLHQAIARRLGDGFRCSIVKASPGTREISLPA